MKINYLYDYNREKWIIRVEVEATMLPEDSQENAVKALVESFENITKSASDLWLGKEINQEEA